MNTQTWLARLIAFPTVSRDSNLALIDEVAAFLDAHGLMVRRIFNPDRTKANLLATLPAKNGKLDGGLVLSGHTDVVPTDGQNWQSDPFRAEIRDGKLYGRGSCDMKGFIAAALNLIPQAAANPPSRALHLAFSYDEEVGCLGAPLMIAEMQRLGLNPEFCIVGEPTGMKQVIAHKGINVFHCRVHGQAAHSSLTPRGVNAIEYAARLMVFISDWAKQLQSTRDDAFDVPFSTLSVNQIHGGVANNIVPELCEFSFDFRNLPEMPISVVTAALETYIRQELEPQMQAVAPHARIEWEQRERVPAMTSAERSELGDIVSTLIADPARRKVAYAAEGGQFQAAGVPTILCGPGHIAQAHKADEYVELAQLAACDQFLAQLLQRI
ncbi:MAG: acetylornithine deacetylase [Neisseria sp.]|nr:acetylornithine deacetylase [Neisseria sp.]